MRALAGDSVISDDHAVLGLASAALAVWSASDMSCRAEDHAVLVEHDVVRVAPVVEARLDLDPEGQLAPDAEHAPDQPVPVDAPGASWIGMKSCTSPTPSGVRKRVMRTFVSGK